MRTVSRPLTHRAVTRDELRRERDGRPGSAPAIDETAPVLSAAGRMSAPHVMLPWRGLYPIPDGTIDAADRKVTANLYSGI